MAPAAAANQESGGHPPQSAGTSFCPQRPPPPQPLFLPGYWGPWVEGGLVIPSPFSPRCCPLEPVLLRVNLLSRQGVTGGVCHSELRPSALLANWGAGARSTGNGRREGAGMREGRLPSPSSHQAWADAQGSLGEGKANQRRKGLWDGDSVTLGILLFFSGLLLLIHNDNS